MVAERAAFVAMFLPLKMFLTEITMHRDCTSVHPSQGKRLGPGGVRRRLCLPQL